MKISACKKAAILATIFGGFVFGTNVEAATIAAVGATNFSDTQIGTIEGSYVTSYINSTPNNTVLSGLNGDTSIFNVVDNGKSSVYIRQYTFSTTNLADSFSFAAQGDWNNEYANGTISDGPNAHGVARKNDFIYIADYDKGTVGVGKERNGTIVDYTAHTVNIKEDLVQYGGVDMNELYAHGESIIVEGDTLYVLANIDNYDSANFNYSSYFGYAPSYLLKYDINSDGSLSFVDCAEMGKNTDRSRLSKFNNHIFATAIGGYQGYGEVNQETSLNVAIVDDNYGTFEGSKPINIPDNIYNTEFRNTKIMPNGTAYVLCYAIDARGWQTITNVYKTTVSNLLADSPQEWECIIEGTEGGWFNDIDAEHYTKRFWFQDGNTIKVFVDGETEPIVFETSQFATNVYYNQIQAWATLKPDAITGSLAKLREQEVNVINSNGQWKVANYNGSLTGEGINYNDKKNEYGIYAFDGDTTIEVNSNYIGDLSNNILASIYANADGVHPEITINGTLSLQAENTIATPVGVYAGNGNRVSITAENINILTKGLTGGNSLTNAIMLDASGKGTQAGIDITGDVHISMTGGYGGNGVAIQKTDRWGEASYSAENKARIIIDGDLEIKGKDNQTWGIEDNKENVLSRFNNAGVLTSVEKGEIIIKGDVDMDVYGNGVTTNATDSSVIIAKGGQITVPKGKNYGYYALAAYQGDISMNMGVAGNNVGNSDVQLNGDIFTIETGNIKLALTTEDSYLNGIIDNGGTVDLHLQNGAVWNNIANNTRYALDYEDVGNGEKSLVTNFYGGSDGNSAGVIVQSAESKGLTVKNYSGNTKVLYSRDINEPTKVLGGNITIESAKDNSVITLRTDNSGITMTDEAQVDATLNNLANKLYYTAYVEGQDNLKGYVEIAEGLTASSAIKTVGNIEFNTETGQGSLLVSGNTGEGTGGNEGEGTGDIPTTPDEPVEPEKPSVEIGTPVTGENLGNNDALKDEAGNSIVEEDTEAGKTVIYFGKLDVDKDGKEKPKHEHVGHVKIEPEKTDEDASLISSAGNEKKDYVFELDGKDFSLVGGTTGENKEAKGIEAVNGTVTINKAGDVLIEATAENGKAHAIYASGAGNDVVIVRDEDNKDAKITMVAKDNDKSAAVLHADKGANVKIDGIVDITQTNGKEAIAVGEGSKVEIAGGVIGGKAEEGKDNVAIKVINGGKIKINEAGDDHDVVINGKIVLGVPKPVEEKPVMMKLARRVVIPEDASSVSLTTADSALNDDVQYGGSGDNRFGVTIVNGATWNGNSIGGVDLNVVLSDSGVWTGYHDDSATDPALNLQISNGAEWYNEATDATTIDKLVGADVNDTNDKTGFVHMSEAENAGLTVNDYSGEITFIYNHDDNNDILGGDVTIKVAQDGSIVNVRTGSIGSMDKEEISRVLNALAAKVYAAEEAVPNVSGQAQIAEGMLTSSNSLRFGDILFNEQGQGTVDESSINYGATAGDYETAMMSGAKSAMTSSAMMWRAEANDIMKRMGDLRMVEGEQGIWAKYYGTKQEMEAQNAKYTNSYKAYQLGYDKKVGDWTVGVAASYGDGESTYANGRGENSVVSLGLYGAWNGKDGQYVDVIMKRSKLDNEYTLNGNVFIGQIEADYETWATSISAEYGKRFETAKGFYVEPSAELTLGRVEGENYNTSFSLGGERLNVQQDDYDTLVGRLGLRLGQKLDKASYYAKFAVAKEFAGDFDTKYSTIGKSGGATETKETSMSFKDTWYEMQIGGTAQINDNSYIYASYERNFGADVEQKWRVDAGLRFTF